MIGVFGGTFDPIHYGHLRPAKEALVTLGLEQVRFVPAARPPHRRPPVASAEQRLRMVELAVADEPGFVVDDRELRRPGPSYTVDTLMSMREEFGERTLCLLLGTDAFVQLETWHCWQQLPQLAHLVVMPRPGWPIPDSDSGLPAWARGTLVQQVAELARATSGFLFFLRVTPQDISATRIREVIADGDTVADWLPPAEFDYICQHGIYRK